ncbi:MAG TPA: flagellar biosynthesis protein FlhA, partial [Oligoflexia bacterium]|nr:flagellar biosynthesis protein FlhA [Oligoflexia bacterium]
MRGLDFTATSLARLFSGLFARSTLTALFLLLVILLFIVELPPALLDFLLVSNLFISLVLLLHGLFMNDPLRLFSFPTMLVLTTLFRLSLNISSTKLILLHGDQGLSAAGEVIRSFGSFVVRGDFVVGAIVFAIVAVVNFVVIARGSARVAEVAARFVLDALPGRQLAIDAELRAGNITRKEAARLRSELTRESQFFGSMDGAMKWVQGDAIAALVIVFINAVGGVIIGISREMPVDEAVSTFGILAIGDGLVSILPALLISVAAGVIVTHVTGREKRDAGEEIFLQVFSDSRPLLIAAIAMLFVSIISLAGVIPFPFTPFFLISIAMLFFGGRAAAQKNMMKSDVLGDAGVSAISASEGAEYTSQRSRLEEVIVEIPPAFVNGNYQVIPAKEEYAEKNFFASFSRQENLLRRRIYEERGIVLPPIVLRMRKHLQANDYRILVRGRAARTGRVDPDKLMTNLPPRIVNLFSGQAGQAAAHPVDRRCCAWIRSTTGGLGSFEELGVEILPLPQFLLQEAAAAVFEHIDESFGLNEVHHLLEVIREEHARLLAEVFESGRLSLPEFTGVLRRLVRERVSIRDVRLILEGVVEFCSLNPSAEDRLEWLAELHAFLRIVLQRSIQDDLRGLGGELRVFVLSQEIEEEFRAAVSSWDFARGKLPLDPAVETSLRTQAQIMFDPVLERGSLPVVVLAQADIRPAVHDFF